MSVSFRQAIAACVLGGAFVSLSGCFPLAATGIVAGAMSATDRRSIGAQTDDQVIELKAGGRLREALPNAKGIGVTSYNRKVLLTGAVADDAVKREAEAVIRKLESVRSVHNELVVGFTPALATSANDSGLTARVKGALVEARDVQSNTIKVVTEAGVVYLMGLVTSREGERAGQVAARISGVQRVVTVFEYVTDEDLAKMSR